MNKPYALMAIVCCIAVLGGLVLLPACADYRPERTDTLVLAASEQQSVAWADLSVEGRCPLEEVRLRLSAEPTDLWVSDRGNHVVALSAAVLPLCYLGEEGYGMYTLYADAEASFGSVDNVFLPLPSVEALGLLTPSITVETPTATREMTVKDFCLECGLCAYNCPAKRALVQSISLAKSKIREMKNGK